MQSAMAAIAGSDSPIRAWRRFSTSSASRVHDRQFAVTAIYTEFWDPRPSAVDALSGDVLFVIQYLDARGPDAAAPVWATLAGPLERLELVEGARPIGAQQP
jgi:hypothetical protein